MARRKQHEARLCVVAVHRHVANRRPVAARRRLVERPRPSTQVDNAPTQDYARAPQVNDPPPQDYDSSPQVAGTPPQHDSSPQDDVAAASLLAARLLAAASRLAVASRQSAAVPLAAARPVAAAGGRRRRVSRRRTVSRRRSSGGSRKFSFRNVSKFVTDKMTALEAIGAVSIGLVSGLMLPGYVQRGLAKVGVGAKYTGWMTSGYTAYLAGALTTSIAWPSVSTRLKAINFETASRNRHHRTALQSTLMNFLATHGPRMKTGGSIAWHASTSQASSLHRRQSRTRQAALDLSYGYTFTTPLSMRGQRS